MVQSSSSSSKRSTFLFSPLPTIFFLTILCILAYYSRHFLHSSPSSSSSSSNLRFQKIFLSTSTNDTLSSYLRALTLHPHLAGTKAAWETINYVQSHFNHLELETHTVRYKTLLSYPLHSSLSLHFPNGTVLTVPLAEPDSGPGSGVVVPYHAYSPSGSAHAKPVFVNYGRDEDYHALARIGVNVSGCIVIARRGDLPRGSVVERAEAYGAQAVLLYAEQGEEDRFRKGVERGTVMRGIGDPLTPGWASVDGSERLDSMDNEVLERFPNIPSMPLSAESGEVILGLMGRESVPVEWRDSLPAGPRGVGLRPVSLNFSYQVGT